MFSPFIARARVALGLGISFALGIVVTAGWRETASRVALAHARPLPDGAIRLIVAQERLRFEFATPMVGAAALDLPGATAGVDVTLDPPQPLSLWWSSPTTLEVRLAEPLPRARRTQVRLAAGLVAIDGRCVEPAREFDVAAPGPRVVDLQLAPPPAGSAAPSAFALEFDLPIAAAALQTALSVTAPTGAPLVAHVTSRDGTRHLVQLESSPATPLPPQVEVALAATLCSTVGPLPMGEPYRAPLELAAPLRFRRAEATASGLSIRFNHALVDFDPALVRVEPSSPWAAELRDGALLLRGTFPAGRALTLHLATDFPGRGLLRLAAAEQHALFVPDRRPQLDFARRGEVLSSAAGAELEVATVNVPRFEVALWSIYPNNVVALALDVDTSLESLAAPPRRAFVEVTAARNEGALTRVDLAALFGAPPVGPCVVELTAPEAGIRWPERRLLQVSELGLSARVGVRDAVVAVRTLASDLAVADADVALYTPTRQRLVRGRTDGEGLAVLTLPAPQDDRVPYLVVVTHGDEVAWLELERFRVDLAHLPVGGAPPTPIGGLEVLLHPTRGLVRPGQTIDATALVRERDGRAAAGVPVIARWLDARGRLRRRQEFEVPGSGLLPLTFETSVADATGAWRVELLRGGLAPDDAARPRLAEATLFVETFVPDRLEAQGAWLAPLVAGEPCEWQLEARWLAGGVAAGRRVVVRPRVDVARFEPPVDGASGSGLLDASFADLERRTPPGDLAPIETVTDALGRARVRCSLPPLPAGIGAWHVLLQAEVDDPSGRVVRTQSVASAVRAGTTLGVRPLAGGVEVVACGGAPDTTLAVDVELQARQWQWGSDGNFESRVAIEVVATRRVVVPTPGRIEVELPAWIEASGRWPVVVVRGGGQRCELELAAAGARPDRLALSGPERVVAGGAFELTVDAPFAGHALVTLEGERLHGARLVAVAAGRSTLTLQVPAEELGPTVHAVVTLTRPQARRDATPPDWLVGALPLQVDRSAAFLPVAVTAPSHVEPGATVVVAIDARGATAATVALVDVGTLQQTRHRDADPRAEFLLPRRLITRGADSRVALLAGARFPLERLVGGDDALVAANLALGTTTIEVVALFRGDVVLDADGHAELRFPLPSDYEGRLRVAVVAAGPMQVGAAGSDLEVSAPLSLQLAAPRRLSAGDRAEAVATLCNRTGAALELEWSAQVGDGLALADGAAARGTFTLAVDERRDWKLALQATAFAGAGTLRVDVRGGGHERSVVRPVPVAPRARFERRREALELSAGDHALTLGSDWLGESVAVRLVVDTRPDRQLEPMARALIDYPHGCIEQTASRCHALLAALELFPQLVDDREQPPEALLAAGIERLLSMQLGSGGFSYWPGGAAPHRFGTLWAFDLLLRAQAAGRAVPADAVARARSFIEREIAASRADLEACFAIELLSRSGRPFATRLETLAMAPPDGEGALLLALAAVRLGQEPTARALLARADSLAATTSTSESFGSPLRREALELRVRLALDPADRALAPLADRLRGAIAHPERTTTQEQAQLMLALADYFARFASGEAGAPALLQIGTQRQELRCGEPVSFRVRPHEALQLHCPGARFAALEVQGLTVESTARGFPDFSLARRFVDVESGRELAAGETLRRGRLYDLFLDGRVAGAMPQLLLSDLLPAGIESEPTPGDREARATGAALDHVEVRDDRVLFFLDVRDPAGRFTLHHRVRAVFAGRFASGATQLESLYEPGRQATLPSTNVEVSP